MAVKSPEELQKSRVANHYVIEPVNPTPVSIDERLPLAPPRGKDARRPQMKKSATLPNPKKSAPLHKPAPYRPPPPKVTSPSATPPSPSSDKDSPAATTITAPPRRKKSTPIYEEPTVKQSTTSVSSDTVQEYEECYVEPVDTPEEIYEPAEYIEISLNDNNEQKTNENGVSTDSGASKENDKETITVKPAATDVTTADESVPASDSSADQQPKEPADPVNTKEKDQNLTILQAKKMFEAKQQSTPNSDKVMSPISKVATAKKTDLKSAEQSAKTKVVTEQKHSETNDKTNLPPSANDEECLKSMTAKQEQSSSMADQISEENEVCKNEVDVQVSKNLIPAKPSKPALAKKPNYISAS